MTSLANTFSFALQGIALASTVGFLLALGYKFTLVRAFCAFIRSIHELFWALLFIQIAGLSSLTGLLAIAIPYAGTLAKIYGELFEEVDPSPINNLPSQSHESEPKPEPFLLHRAPSGMAIHGHLHQLSF